MSPMKERLQLPMHEWLMCDANVQTPVVPSNALLLVYFPGFMAMSFEVTESTEGIVVDHLGDLESVRMLAYFVMMDST